MSLRLSAAEMADKCGEKNAAGIHDGDRQACVSLAHRALRLQLRRIRPDGRRLFESIIRQGRDKIMVRSSGAHPVLRLCHASGTMLGAPFLPGAAHVVAFGPVGVADQREQSLPSIAQCSQTTGST
ncbi:MAG: hypothetical protein E6848_17390, partial [Bradyrhizobium sp.]|nr:hypothetical protein [Bradyrhizobium sp.]